MDTLLESLLKEAIQAELEEAYDENVVSLDQQLMLAAALIRQGIQPSNLSEAEAEVATPAELNQVNPENAEQVAEHGEAIANGLASKDVDDAAENAPGYYKGLIYIVYNVKKDRAGNILPVTEVKIGWTARPVEERLKEFNKETSSTPHWTAYATFPIQGQWKGLPDKIIHKAIKYADPGAREDSQREFFYYTPEEAFNVLNQIQEFMYGMDEGIKYNPTPEQRQKAAGSKRVSNTVVSQQQVDSAFINNWAKIIEAIEKGVPGLVHPKTLNDKMYPEFVVDRFDRKLIKIFACNKPGAKVQVDFDAKRLSRDKALSVLQQLRDLMPDHTWESATAEDLETNSGDPGSIYIGYHLEGPQRGEEITAEQLAQYVEAAKKCADAVRKLKI